MIDSQTNIKMKQKNKIERKKEKKCSETRLNEKI